MTHCTTGMRDMQMTIKKIQIVGDEENMSLHASLACSPGDCPKDMRFDAWLSWFDENGQQDNKVETSFNFTGETAIALRDFLIFCFPLDDKAR